MTEILRNMFRRKTRTGLTIFGIVIGVLALTVMGAMSEYFSVLVDNGEKFSGSNIGVTPQAESAADTYGIQGLSGTTLRQLQRLEGVKEALPEVYGMLGETSAVSMGIPEMVVGILPDKIQFHLSGVSLKKGRWLERGDKYHAVVGTNVAQKRNLDVGQTIKWRDEEFTVVGILNSTRTAPDEFVYIPLEIARKLMGRTDWIASITVVPKDTFKAEELVTRINGEIPRVKAKSPKQAMDEIRKSLNIFNVIMLSGAILAAVVGGLSVMNTMIMSVHERTREIGIKKAVGAATGDIVREYVTEAAFIGALGGVVGLVLGWLMTILLNRFVALSMGNVELWLVTPRLVFSAFAFAVTIGAIAGLYPAWRGARLEPVEALRTE